MSKIPQKDSKPEITVRRYLFSKGFRYRANVKTLSGSPDIVLSKYKTVIFIHGCFWHGHTCRGGHLPSTNIDFWVEKINKNKERDIRQITELQSLGWNVIVIWQCQIKNKKLKEERLSKLEEEIRLNLK